MQRQLVSKWEKEGEEGEGLRPKKELGGEFVK